MKPAAWFGLLVIMGGMAFGAKAFVSNLTPYVSVSEAKKSQASVQVMGKLDKASVKNDASGLEFAVVDKAGDKMPVVFKSARPANFEMAIEVTAIGHYDGQIFRADNLLVKCPTKYQGTETKSYSSGG